MLGRGSFDLASIAAEIGIKATITKEMISALLKTIALRISYCSPDG